ALVKNYNESIDRESAYEMLNKKLEASVKAAEKEKELVEKEKQIKQENREKKIKQHEDKPLIDNQTKKRLVNSAITLVQRGLLGLLKRR
ncbi:MAG TPA: DUF853 family protein, partial [Chitinophagales bacterium]|nr:DUF853 family protein [Chitinophagales bacterium]HRH54109.1 DUF853 family protein [Chitinophagales bacterium]